MTVEIEDLVQHKRRTLRHDVFRDKQANTPAMLSKKAAAAEIALRVLPKVGGSQPE